MTVPISLDEAMEQAAEWVKISSGKSEGMPCLLLFDDDNALTVCGLAVEGGGPDIAQFARMLVFQQNPRIAVLQIEGWMARRDLPHTDPDFRRAALGEIAISDMPRDKRDEMVILYGETRDDQTLYRHWIVDNDADGKRVGLSPMDMPDDVTHKSRFHPLFLVPSARKALDDLSSLPAELRLKVAMLDEAEKQSIACGVVSAALAMGAGRDSRENRESHAQGIKWAVQEILKGPAAS